LKTPVSHGNESYEAVLIGTQTWLARNLNYEPSTGNFSCYDNDSKKCDTYGLLYDWATAMDLSSSCLNLSCSYSLPRKGICPEGWHLPSDAEWEVLKNYAGGSTAGTKLKATNGWSSGSIALPGAGGNGTDSYGFSGLPGGYYCLGCAPVFRDNGSYGYWWSATESNNSNYASYYDMYSGYEWLFKSGNDKSFKQSIRCLKDE
jgi:uncharacterized protein (TIGR02145 family)